MKTLSIHQLEALAHIEHTCARWGNRHFWPGTSSVRASLLLLGAPGFRPRMGEACGSVTMSRQTYRSLEQRELIGIQMAARPNAAMTGFAMPETYVYLTEAGEAALAEHRAALNPGAHP